MEQKTRVPPLRWILPVGQLILCTVILWPLRPMLIGQIRTSLWGYDAPHSTTARIPVAPVVRPFDLSEGAVQRRIKSLQAREWTVAGLNLAGGLPDLTYAMLSPEHSEWTPTGMLMWTWRDLSWPIIGIFFWWLAGRSLEALLFSRHRVLLPKIRWWEVAVSLPVLAFGAMWAIGVSFDQSARAEFPMWRLLAVFGSMWFLLGASTLVAFVVQWRLRRRLASSTAQQSGMLTTTT